MKQYIEKVKDYYSDDKNKYHTIHHIKNMFDLYKKYRKEFLSEFPDLNENRLFQSIAWHDSVYVVGNKFNEDESAKKYLKEEDDISAKVYFAILSTKIGNIHFETDIEKVLHDLDWSGFIDYDTMIENEKKIIYEAICDNKFTEEEVKKNQKNFYKSFVNNDIYVTKTFKQFNKIAKQNLQKRIAEMN